jgi:hypothetical protein
MKKIIIVTIVIIGLIIGATGSLIKIENNKLNKDNIQSDLEGKDELVENTQTKEKTLDLYGTYNQNDLFITDKNISHDLFDKPIQIKEIGGLKNKEIENKINESMEKKILLEIENFLKEYELPYNDVYVYNYSNFSNVISFYCTISGRDIAYSGVVDFTPYLLCSLMLYTKPKALLVPFLVLTA